MLGIKAEHNLAKIDMALLKALGMKPVWGQTVRDNNSSTRWTVCRSLSYSCSHGLRTQRQHDIPNFCALPIFAETLPIPHHHPPSSRPGERNKGAQNIRSEQLKGRIPNLPTFVTPHASEQLEYFTKN